MKLMGMKGWLHWASCYFKFSVFMFISVVMMTFLFHVKIGDDRAIITYGDSTITFVFLLLYALSVMTFCFAISTFFSKGMIIVHEPFTIIVPQNNDKVQRITLHGMLTKINIWTRILSVTDRIDRTVSFIVNSYSYKLKLLTHCVLYMK